MPRLALGTRLVADKAVLSVRMVLILSLVWWWLLCDAFGDAAGGELMVCWCWFWFFFRGPVGDGV